MTENEHDYANGLRDGRLQALEKVTGQHHDRLNNHADRLKILERLAWIMIGVIGFIQVWPAIHDFLTRGS